MTANLSLNHPGSFINTSSQKLVTSCCDSAFADFLIWFYQVKMTFKYISSRTEAWTLKKIRNNKRWNIMSNRMSQVVNRFTDRVLCSSSYLSAQSKLSVDIVNANLNHGRKHLCDRLRWVAIEITLLRRISLQRCQNNLHESARQHSDRNFE